MSLQVLDPLNPSSTSAAGAMRAAPPRHVLLGFDLSCPGTCGLPLIPEDWPGGFADRAPEGTFAITAREPVANPTDARTALSELRRLSGLTWEQLAEVIRVSRRTLHLWASGKPINATNEGHLRRLLATLRQADRGTAQANRAMLLTDRDGTIPIDLLVAGRYDEFLRLVGEGAGRRRMAMTPLSPEAREARRPLSPDELAGALHDRVHRDVGRGRAARTLRSKRRGSER